ncbi:DUF4247 domain-containing protein [Glycomyces buryatensis]|uniref:DUF4247 domain-containing protein n=1 Tax=Glycomyces buryatensis TaxID=2570927 RepID=A0A4S8PT81_9ACTN|nr:DUF4247 domain-containing protein [Glycomyces buryatensis]THV34610.1 DUF4247 domain-containing protein [Glycomyces buryatensis]
MYDDDRPRRYDSGDEPAPSPLSGLNWKHWTAIVVVIALCCGGVILANTDFNDPTDTIKSHYTREATLDEGGGTAYTSASSPATVASEIADDADPREERSDNGTYYLQYSKHIVAVSPNGTSGGSKILLHDYKSGYNHYSGVFLLWGWPSSPPGPFRGGGPGSGK